MAVTTNITLSNGVDDITIPVVAYMYKTRVLMPIHYSQGRDNTVRTYDTGQGLKTYDRRTCECQWVLNHTDQEALSTFLRDPGKGRGAALTLTLATNSGFYPFGPDFGDTGDFQVQVIGFRPSGQQHIPYKYYRSLVTMQYLDGPTPAYSLPTQYPSGGCLQIGNITNLRYPQEGYDVTTTYTIDNMVTMDGRVHVNDLGVGGDTYDTGMVYEDHHNKMAAVIDYLQTTARGSKFTIQTGADNYIFGIDNGGSGTYTVQLTKPELIITHIDYDRFAVELDIKRVA